MKTRSKSVISANEFQQLLQQGGRPSKNAHVPEPRSESVSKRVWEPHYDEGLLIIPVETRMSFAQSVVNMLESQWGVDKTQSLLYLWTDPNVFIVFTLKTRCEAKRFCERYRDGISVEGRLTKAFRLFSPRAFVDLLRDATFSSVQRCVHQARSLPIRGLDACVQENPLKVNCRDSEVLYLNESPEQEILSSNLFSSFLVAVNVVHERKKSPFVHWGEMARRCGIKAKERKILENCGHVKLTSPEEFRRRSSLRTPIEVRIDDAHGGSSFCQLSDASRCYKDPRLKGENLRYMLQQGLTKEPEEKDEEPFICPRTGVPQGPAGISGEPCFRGYPLMNSSCDDSKIPEKIVDDRIEDPVKSPCVGRIVRYFREPGSEKWRCSFGTATSCGGRGAVTAAHCVLEPGGISESFFEPGYHRGLLHADDPLLPDNPDDYADAYPLSAKVVKVKFFDKLTYARHRAPRKGKYNDHHAAVDVVGLELSLPSAFECDWEFEQIDPNGKELLQGLYTEGYGFEICKELARQHKLISLYQKKKTLCEEISAAKGHEQSRCVYDEHFGVFTTHQYLLAGHSGSLVCRQDPLSSKRKAVGIYSGQNYYLKKSWVTNQEKRYPYCSLVCAITPYLFQKITEWIETVQVPPRSSCVVMKRPQRPLTLNFEDDSERAGAKRRRGLGSRCVISSQS